MSIERRLNGLRQLMLDEICEQPDEVLALPDRHVSLASFVLAPLLEPFQLAPLLQPSAFSLQHCKRQKSYPIHIANFTLRNHSLPVFPSRKP
jgi:hypothetical protein